MNHPQDRLERIKIDRKKREKRNEKEQVRSKHQLAEDIKDQESRDELHHWRDLAVEYSSGSRGEAKVYVSPKRQ